MFITVCVYINRKASVAFNPNCWSKMTAFSRLQAVTYTESGSISEMLQDIHVVTTYHYLGSVMWPVDSWHTIQARQLNFLEHLIQPQNSACSLPANEHMATLTADDGDLA